MAEETAFGSEGWQSDLGRSRVVFGPGSLERVGELAREAGAARVLLVTDPGVVAAGHVDSAIAALDRESIKIFVHDAVVENPTTGHVAHAADAARQGNVDAIIGLGGGSAMDCAKGANFLVTNGGRLEDYWGMGKASRPMLPSLGIPTTAGTGSEAQSYALISQEGSGTKMACGDPKALFRAVILDPLLPVTAPRSVAATAGIDALSHSVESYVTRLRNPISQLFAREAWRLLEGNLETVLAAPQDVEAQGRMLLGSFLAGAAIERSMLGAAHACANPLTTRWPIAHGAAVGLMLTHVVRFNASHVGDLYEELQRSAGSDAGPALLEDRVRDLRRTAGLPENLRDYSVPEERLPELAEDAGRQWTAGHNPRPVTPKELLELYEAAY
jgi:alcohol dehydrogenase